MQNSTSRNIVQADALEWLTAQPVLEGCSFITSLPDFSEFPKLTIAEWKVWFQKSVSLILSRTPENGVAIFYQRDGKEDGHWIDKGFLCQKAAEESGHHLLWHKIICRVPPGNVTFGKPGYSHLLCFSRGIRVPLEKSTADVVTQAGAVTWTRGMGVDACLMSCRFVIQQTSTGTIVDPFCGHGTVLAVANELGLNAMGVELGRKRAERARELKVKIHKGAVIKMGVF